MRNPVSSLHLLLARIIIFVHQTYPWIQNHEASMQELVSFEQICRIGHKVLESLSARDKYLSIGTSLACCHVNKSRNINAVGGHVWPMGSSWCGFIVDDIWQQLRAQNIIFSLNFDEAWWSSARLYLTLSVCDILTIGPNDLGDFAFNDLGDFTYWIANAHTATGNQNLLHAWGTLRALLDLQLFKIRTHAVSAFYGE